MVSLLMAMSHVRAIGIGSCIGMEANLILMDGRKPFIGIAPEV